MGCSQLLKKGVFRKKFSIERTL